MASDCPISIDHLEDLVKQYMPFLIRTVSSVTGRYVTIENDDTFSIALEAFAEAVERFEPARGNFMSYAGLVIRSRLNTYLKQENQHIKEISLDALQETDWEVADPNQNQPELHDEIIQYQQELLKFGLTLEALADHAPKHQDTRQRAVQIAEESSNESTIVSQTYQKKKLPVRAVSRLCGVSEKIIKTSKTFILGTMLVFVKKLPGMMSWIRGTRCDHV